MYRTVFQDIIAKTLSDSVQRRRPIKCYSQGMLTWCV